MVSERSISQSRAPRVLAQGVSKNYREGRRTLQALRHVSLAAGDGEFVSIIGPSGCGKSTLFSVIAGVQRPDEGRIFIDGQDAPGGTGLVGYMPQKDLLLPWRTVLDNAILGLDVAGVPKAQAREEARSHLADFGLSGFEDSYPDALSGGMRQRAALLRTILCHKDILLLDEPFGALDALTRSAMHEWLLELWDRLGKTVLLVTHDVEEAVLLSDRVYVMTERPGRIKAELRIRLPRPRRYDVVTTQSFLEHKRELLGLLRGPSAEGRGAPEPARAGV